MQPTLYRTWEDHRRVFVPEAKVIVDTTRNPTSHGPPSMKLLRRKSVQVPPSLASKRDDTTRRQAIFVVDSDTLSVHSKGEESVWYDERGIVVLRKFYAYVTRQGTQYWRVRRYGWTPPFSFFALQCKFYFNQTNVSRLMPCPGFQPPHHPAGMQALLQHSVQSYGPLPSEVRPHRLRSRTSSRPSLYHINRIFKSSVTTNSSKDHSQVDVTSKSSTNIPVFRDLPVTSNTSVAPVLEVLKTDLYYLSGSLANSDGNRNRLL